MARSILAAAFLALMGTSFPVQAGIPEPDTVLYGTVTIDGTPVPSSTDVTIVARVGGVPDAVGSYHDGG